MKTILYISLFTLLFQGYGIAQGEALFKAKCNTCHLVGKNSTGPDLTGVKQKWTDAGEGELLYQWVQNSPGLIASGKSKMANAIKGFSPTDMPAQTVTNEEVDAILSYIDNPPVIADPEPLPGGPVPDPVLTPNYAENLDIFYGLLIVAFVLIVGIILMSNAIITLVKSDYFTKRLKERSQNGGMLTLLILVAVGTMFLPANSFALSYTAPGTSTEPTLWLLVENTDIYLMLTIDLILLSVLLYLRRMFRNFMAMVKEEKEVVQAEPTLRKINQLLTDVVPIEQEEKIMLHHEYDGIRELDNNLPPWWVWGFVATVVFSIIYIFNYHVFRTGDLQIVAYDKEMAKAKAEITAYRNKMAMNVDETTATLMTEKSDLSAGKALFQTNCVTCHNPKGEGNIGPNLTDKSWIYGFDIKEIFKTVKNGTSNGMPEHNSKLNPIQIQQVSSYVLNLPEVKGKVAEGTIIEK